MALPLQRPSDGYLRLSFEGEVGVTGAAVQQTWDLTAIPASVRASAGFTRSLLVFARPLSAGLTDVEADVSFVNDADGVPVEMALEVTAAAASDQIALDVWFLHSIIGAVADASKAYFIQNPGVTADVTSVFGRNGAVVAQLNDYAASLVQNDSGVAGATVDLALDALAAIIAALDSDDIANVSGVAGATVTAALDTLAAVITALDSDDIANVSGVAGATVTAALDALDAALGALDSDDIANVSGVAGATVTAALDTLAAAPPGRFQMNWGNADVSTDTTPRYLDPWWERTSAQGVANIRLVAAADFTLDHMHVLHNIPNGNGNLIVYTLRVNGVATALSVSLASTSSQGSDLANSVAVSEGDLLDIEVTKAVDVGFSPGNITVSLRATPS